MRVRFSLLVEMADRGYMKEIISTLFCVVEVEVEDVEVLETKKRSHSHVRQYGMLVTKSYLKKSN